MPKTVNGSLICISENAKAILRGLGWTEERIESVLRKPPPQHPGAQSTPGGLNQTR